VAVTQVAGPEKVPKYCQSIINIQRTHESLKKFRCQNLLDSKFLMVTHFYKSDEPQIAKRAQMRHVSLLRSAWYTVRTRPDLQLVLYCSHTAMHAVQLKVLHT
jgi:hypothetical protein